MKKFLKMFFYLMLLIVSLVIPSCLEEAIKNLPEILVCVSGWLLISTTLLIWLEFQAQLIREQRKAYHHYLAGDVNQLNQKISVVCTKQTYQEVKEIIEGSGEIIMVGEGCDPQKSESGQMLMETIQKHVKSGKSIYRFEIINSYPEWSAIMLQMSQEYSNFCYRRIRLDSVLQFALNTNCMVIVPNGRLQEPIALKITDKQTAGKAFIDQMRRLVKEHLWRESEEVTHSMIIRTKLETEFKLVRYALNKIISSLSYQIVLEDYDFCFPLVSLDEFKQWHANQYTLFTKEVGITVLGCSEYQCVVMPLRKYHDYLVSQFFCNGITFSQMRDMFSRLLDRIENCCMSNSSIFAIHESLLSIFNEIDVISETPQSEPLLVGS